MAEPHHDIGAPRSDAEIGGELLAHGGHLDFLVDERCLGAERGRLECKALAAPTGLKPMRRIVPLRHEHRDTGRAPESRNTRWSKADRCVTPFDSGLSARRRHSR
jgi:hypothetical protein